VLGFVDRVSGAFGPGISQIVREIGVIRCVRADKQGTAAV